MMLFFTALLILPKEEITPFFISQCYNVKGNDAIPDIVVAPFFISQCYNVFIDGLVKSFVVAPFFISQCYNTNGRKKAL